MKCTIALVFKDVAQIVCQDVGTYLGNPGSMAKINAIETLHQSGHSNRKIARLLGVDRGSVGKYVRRLENPPDSTAEGAHRPGPASACEPLREVITAKLEQGLSARRIFQDIAGEHAFTGSYYSVRRFVARLGEKTPLPVRRHGSGRRARRLRWTSEPGRWSSMRLASVARPWMFRIVLSHSRKGYSEAVWRQTTDNFIAALENAFVHFGGVPKRLVIDNLKAAVARADWYDPEVHPKLQSFAATTARPSCPPSPTRPSTRARSKTASSTPRTMH